MPVGLITHGLGSGLGPLVTRGLIGAAAPAVAVDLLSALEAAYALTSLYPGATLYTVRVPTKAALPYYFAKEITTRAERWASTHIVYRVWIEVRSYGADMDAVGTAGDAFDTAMIGTTFAWGNVVTGPLQREEDPRHEREMRRAKGGPEPYYQCRRYSVRVIRAR